MAAAPTIAAMAATTIDLDFREAPAFPVSIGSPPVLVAEAVASTGAVTDPVAVTETVPVVDMVDMVEGMEMISREKRNGRS